MAGLKEIAHKKRARYLLIAASVLLVLVIGLIVLLEHWPFMEGKVRSDLASATSSEVRFGTFRRQYFPPGCVVENVVFQQGNSGTPLMVIRKLTFESTIPGLLRHHVGLLRAEGLHGVLEFKGFSKDTSGRKVTIDKFVADDAVLEVPRRASNARTQFVFHKFFITNLNGGGVMAFDAVLENPMPRGLVRTSGHFGPWDQSDPGTSPLSGKYSLEKADLAVFHSIAGNISSTGAFRGNLKQVNVQGSTHSTEFVVAKTLHALPLDTDFKANVDASNGDVTVREIKARFGKDDITGTASIARRNDGKRSAIVDLICKRGRIEDTFYPFIHSPKSPLTGDVEFQMHVIIPSGRERFLRKIELTSTFKIQHAQFSKPETQARLSKVSAPPDQQSAQEPAEFQGNVTLSRGVAKFSNLSLNDEGASAFFRGDFNLLDQRVNLHGQLKTAASLTKTTKGIKAVFAKVIEPFFKKRPHETVVPVHIRGTYSHPNFGLDVGG
jgi:AsmA-like C-terminal region